jgi:antitoxin MazE
MPRLEVESARGADDSVPTMPPRIRGFAAHPRRATREKLRGGLFLAKLSKVTMPPVSICRAGTEIPNYSIAVKRRLCYAAIEMARTTAKVLVEVSDRGTITLPKSYRKAKLYEVRPRDGGGIELIPQYTVDASQAWFWSERWQKMEREADKDVAAGRVARFNSADEFLAELDSR